jgi:hypothetical protein
LGTPLLSQTRLDPPPLLEPPPPPPPPPLQDRIMTIKTKEKKVFAGFIISLLCSFFT